MDCWPFILAKTPLLNIRILYCRLSEDKKSLVRGNRAPPASKCVVIIFFRYFKKDFCFVIQINIFCILLTINITFYQGFILSVLYIWLLFSWLSLTQTVFFYFIFSSHFGIWSLWRSNHKNISRPMLFNASGY